MTVPLKKLTDYIINIGADKLPHTKKTYLAHVVAVYRDLKAWACDDELCRSGIFHSIYGTQGFQDFTLPLERREEIRALIGERAELIAYANCAMDRDTFDEQVAEIKDTCHLRDRITGGVISLSRDEYEDLIRLHLCDWLEQAERVDHWDYRREAYRLMAERLGGMALESYNEVYTKEFSVQ